MLRHNHSKSENHVKLIAPVITTKQGLPDVLCSKEEVLGPLADACNYTLIRKFTNTMPEMEVLRKSFIVQTKLSGGVKIVHVNSRRIYIDFDNELYYNIIWTKQRTIIARQQLRIQAWTPSLKPEVETPIVPIWMSLPELPWHMYNKDYVTRMIS